MMIDTSGDERRLTLRLLSYWEKKRGVRAMPREEDIDPADIADLWEYCFVAQVADIEKKNYPFTYLGKTIEDVYRFGLPLDEARGAILQDTSILTAHYDEVAAKATPFVGEGDFTNPHGDQFSFRQVLMPLGEGDKVQAIFGGMRFLRIYAYS